MRYPRGHGQGIPLSTNNLKSLPIGKGEILQRGQDVLIIAYGSMVYPALQTSAILSENGIEATVINARFVKPLDTELMMPLARQIGVVVTMEEGCLDGGFGTAIAEALIKHHIFVPIIRIGVPDQLVEHATPEEAKLTLGLSPKQKADHIRVELQSLRPVSLQRSLITMNQ